MDAPKIQVLLADDHALVRRGFRHILEQDPGIEVVAEATTGAEAVRLARELQPDVVVLDVTMPGGIGGIEATKQIGAGAPKARVVILTMHGEDSYLAESFAAGARGYLLKDSTDVELVQAVRTVHRGNSYLSPTLTSKVLEDYMQAARGRRGRNGLGLLTDRERQVLCLVAQGKSNKEVSYLLNLSQNTVETHRARCMDKLGLHNTAELVLFAVRKGLVS